MKKDNRQKVLSVFFDDPTQEAFQLREISRKINLAPKSVKTYLDELEKGNLITKSKHRIHAYPTYSANRDNDYFRFLKKIDTITTIKECGLLDYLNSNCMPDAVILFGSASKGEDVKGSDIDLFLLCKQKELALEKYEKILSRKINVFFTENFNNISKELKNNVLNGTILSGYLKVF